MMTDTINIIDLFAGPGGLGEGFSSYEGESKNRPFRIRMSVEKEQSAHQTLTLRAVFRKLREEERLDSYWEYAEGKITKDEFREREPVVWCEAEAETMGRATALGEDNETIHARLRELKEQHKDEPWIVIGGPPCQAYSLVGRSRNMGIAGYSAEEDHRHFLYREYLQVLSIMEPDVFVMENVKGILTSRVGGKRIFPQIREDLKHPAAALGKEKGTRYRIYSFVTGYSESPDDPMEPDNKHGEEFVIRAENYGIPQARHRVILLGVADHLTKTPGLLKKSGRVNIENVLYSGLPELRSKLSKTKDSGDAWRQVIQDQAAAMKKELLAGGRLRLVYELDMAIEALCSMEPVQARQYAESPKSFDLNAYDLIDWLRHDSPGKLVLNHESRGHMESDLGRYLFSACWAKAGEFPDKPVPKASDFPDVLAPDHANWKTGKFADRFRVQREGRPATTITSHISKDGHYYIHPDPRQCRSLTVREAARIQTFPDNYFFEGNRTQQYVQVGNAVPPYLARQLARIVRKIF